MNSVSSNKWIRSSYAEMTHTTGSVESWKYSITFVKMPIALELNENCFKELSEYWTPWRATYIKWSKYQKHKENKCHYLFHFHDLNESMIQCKIFPDQHVKNRGSINGRCKRVMAVHVHPTPCYKVFLCFPNVLVISNSLWLLNFLIFLNFSFSFPSNK